MAKKGLSWRTCMILQELEREVTGLAYPNPSPNPNPNPKPHLSPSPFTRSWGSPTAACRRRRCATSWHDAMGP
eukprot:scaffold97080_cov33-Phaeocystis_antarctica.AAC.2